MRVPHATNSMSVQLNIVCEAASGEEVQGAECAETGLSVQKVWFSCAKAGKQAWPVGIQQIRSGNRVNSRREYRDVGISLLC
jgi:hypothetical protein